jgi:hypothetical protein
MRIRRDRSRDGDSISARLLLGDAPTGSVAFLQFQITIDEFGPLDSSLYIQCAVLAIQTQDSIQLSDIDQLRIRAELLASHRVPPTRN